MADIIPSGTQGTLRVEIQYDTPIAANNFADFTSGLANQFRRFAAANLEDQRPELYIERIERGSIIVELIAATTGAMAVANNVNIILDFVNHLKAGFDYVLGRSERPKGMTKTRIKEIGKIVKPISKGKSTQLNIGVLNINIDSIVISNDQARQILSGTATEEREAIRTLPKVDMKGSGNVFSTTDVTRVSLVFTKIEKNGGDYFCEGVIEKLSEQPATISFKSPAIESEILRPQGVNPLENTYTVDVRIITNRRRTVGYEVVNLHRAISN